MWRAFFLAAGGILVFTGVEALVLDHAVLAKDSGFSETVVKNETVLDDWGFEVEKQVVTSRPKSIAPPEWAPWSMLSSGAVIMLYSFMGKSSGE